MTHAYDPQSYIGGSDEDLDAYYSWREANYEPDETLESVEDHDAPTGEDDWLEAAYEDANGGEI